MILEKKFVSSVVVLDTKKMGEQGAPDTYS
jgi:hypothetical protein